MKTPVNIQQLGSLLLLPVFFLLHHYNALFGFIPISYLVLVALCCYAVAFGIVGVLRLKAVGWPAALFISFCCLFFLLFYGAWHDFIKSLTGNAIWGRYSVVLPVTLVLYIAFARYLIKKPAVLSYLTVVLLLLCGVELFNLFSHYRQYQKDHNLVMADHSICGNYKAGKLADTAKPDIYLLVFDEYTNNQSLQALWHFDNSAVTNWLGAKGFTMVNESKANYNFTPYAMSSLLNMQYLGKGPRDKDDMHAHFLKAVASMSNNETFCVLKKEHYRFHFISPFNNSFNNLPIEREFDHYAEKKLFDHTFPGRIRRDFFWRYKTITYQKRDRDNATIINSIKSTADTITTRPPHFVYGHLMITHTPHVYDASGGIRNKGSRPFDSYIDQVQKANTVIQDLVQHILSNNKRNTLIMVMGDHGFRQLPTAQLKYYYPNFCAFYWPGKQASVPQQMTAVNTFRYVLNCYFCQNLELLKDSSILVKY